MTAPAPGEVGAPPLEAGRPGDAQPILDHLAAGDASRADDAARMLDRVTALASMVARAVEASQTEADSVRGAVAEAIERSSGRTEDLRGGDTDRLVERLTALETAAAAAERRRDEQAAALLAAIDERLEKVLSATARTVEGADASRRAQLDALIGALTDAVDALAHAEGRIDSLAGAHVGEARAVEDRVAGLVTGVGEQAEAAVDRSRARIAEGQVALGARFEHLVADLLTTIHAVNSDLGTTLATSIDGLRAAGSGQSAALLDAVNRSRGEAGEVERAGLDALLIEVAAGRHDQLRAVEAVAARVDEVGPLVARALLAEVERAARAASAAEDAAVGATELSAERFARLELAIGERTGGAEAQAIEEAWREVRTLHSSVCAAIQEGARAAELTASDVRSLRDRITPHLVALGEATTRRVDADQAGFDAVLARMDQLLPTRPSLAERTTEPAVGDRPG